MFIRQVIHGVIFGGIALLMMSGNAYAKVQADQLVKGADGAKSTVKEVKPPATKVARRQMRRPGLRRRSGMSRRPRASRRVLRHRTGVRRPRFRTPRKRIWRSRRYRPSIIVVPRTYYYYDSRPAYSSRCNYWHRRCVDSWGVGNKNYRGCMRYHDCD